MIRTRFRPQIETAAAAHGLDPDVVEAVVLQESAGRWYAYRYEPAFYTRYLAGVPAWRDRDPQEISASYGLMQVLYTTALAHGFAGDPWDLFRPDVALDLGCRILAALLATERAQYTGPAATADATILAAALAAYNGGLRGNLADQAPDRNAAYATAVLATVLRLKQGR